MKIAAGAAATEAAAAAGAEAEAVPLLPPDWPPY